MFQSTHLLRGATSFLITLFRGFQCFNPRTSCEVRPDTSCVMADHHLVSIHAPLARCDSTSISTVLPPRSFNPRTSCEVRPRMALLLIPDAMFQSTHLLRGATSSHTWFSSVDPFQSTHLLRGATDCRYPIRIQFHVSIHAPLARCDRPARTGRRETAGFNPRTSCEVRPGLRLEYSKLGLVSIHAPLARCDMDFQQFLTASKAFQSTHLLRGATLDISTLG